MGIQGYVAALVAIVTYEFLSMEIDICHGGQLVRLEHGDESMHRSCWRQWMDDGRPYILGVSQEEARGTHSCQGLGHGIST